MGRNKNKIILDLCGGTGAWSRPYKDAGYDVRNITSPEYDVRNINIFEGWLYDGKDPQNRICKIEDVYGILAAPPCTMFSDARTHAKTPRNLKIGMDIVKACLDIIYEIQFKIKSDQQKYSPLKFWALENPWYGRTKWFLGYPTYIFNPWEFGDMYKKKTALWGYFNPPIKTVILAPDKMKPSPVDLQHPMKKFDMLLMPELKELKSRSMLEDWKKTGLRQTLRSITPKGFAEAFFKANQ